MCHICFKKTFYLYTQFQFSKKIKKLSRKLTNFQNQFSRQPSPGSGTTGTSTVSSSAPDGENGQSINLYPVGSVGPTPTNPTTATPITTTATISLATPGTRSQEPGPSITRSVSAPSAPRPVVQVAASTSSNNGTQKQRLRRTMSRTEAIRKLVHMII